MTEENKNKCIVGLVGQIGQIINKKFDHISEETKIYIGYNI